MSGKFNYPFRYDPAPETKAASATIMEHIDSTPWLREAAGEGKMFGVLIVEPEEGGIGYDEGLMHRLPDGKCFIAAFSGNIGEMNLIEGFVPPVFDLLDPKGYFKTEEARINAVGREIAAIESGEICSGDITEALGELRQKRKTMSDSLQKWIFSSYRVHNGSREEKSISEIFEMKGLVPPGGTGDCAAPKLLDYAFTHGLRPVSMGEFWYCADSGLGTSGTEKRVKGEFYPSCSSKCGPLLRWMLQGVDTDNPYGFDDSTVPAILWEDSSLMVVDKPAGMLCVPGKDGQISMVERLPQPCFAVHRLDMDTSGVILTAKTLRAQSTLRKQFEAREVSKSYVAVVENRTGLTEGQTGTISLPMRPDIEDRPRQIVDFTCGKETVTEYSVLGSNDANPGQDGKALAIVRFKPLTGRTHQLRVHATAGLGCPILGDLLYGGKYYRRLCLHAESISFLHPLTEERMSFSVPHPFTI